LDEVAEEEPFVNLEEQKGDADTTYLAMP